MDLKNYLIISNICLVISFLLFRILNRDETMFRQRRIFIILSVTLSLILPLSGLRIQFPQPVKEDIVVNAAVNQTISPLVQPDTPGVIKNTGISLLYLYLIVSSIIILNILFQLSRIFWFYLVSEKKDGYIIKVSTKGLDSAFSFFRWIFIPQNHDKDVDLQSIITHETVHGKQLHTLDNIIVEIACALMWFNPFIWIMKREIHLLHEYLADEGTLESGIEKISYQSLLINQVAEEKLIVIPSSFKNNHLKKRIIMMTQNKKEGHNGLVRRKLIPLSVLILAVSILQAFYPVNVKGQNKNKQQQPEQQDQVKQDKSKEVYVIGYGLPDTTGMKKAIQSARTSVNNGNTLLIINDKESTKADYDKIDWEEDVASVSVFKGNVTKAFTDKNYDEVVVVTKKGYISKYGKAMSSQSIISDKYMTSKSITGYSASGVQFITSSNENVLYILDDKEVSKEEIENLQPEKVESLTVIEDKDEIKIFTEKDYDAMFVLRSKKDYQGQNKNSIMKDVEVIGYANQDSSRSSSSKIRIRRSGVNTTDSLAKANIRRTDRNESNNILYIVDNQELSRKEFLNIPSKKFDSLFVVMDDKKSVREYTDKDYDGVIVVTTKK